MSKKNPKYQKIKSNKSKFSALLTIFLNRSQQLSEDQFSKEKELAKQISKNNSTERDNSFRQELV